MSTKRPVIIKRLAAGGWSVLARLTSGRTVVLERGPMGWRAARECRDSWLHRLRPAPRNEVLGRLAVLRRQGQEIAARGERILGKYEADEVNWLEEPDDSRFSGVERPGPHDGTLHGRIAERTRRVVERLSETMADLDDDIWD